MAGRLDSPSIVASIVNMTSGLLGGLQMFCQGGASVNGTITGTLTIVRLQ
jgi:hypothetical protein